jgi:hypothetical protein
VGDGVGGAGTRVDAVVPVNWVLLGLGPCVRSRDGTTTFALMVLVGNLVSCLRAKLELKV